MENRVDIRKIFIVLGLISLQAALWISCTEEAEKGDGLIFNVPRTETTSGPSILDNPLADRTDFAGQCSELQVFCNGACLTDEAPQSGNCTLLHGNIGEAGGIAMDQAALYYTAEKAEILKLDLQTLVPTSLVTGLSTPTALYATSGILYFGNNPTTTGGAVDHPAGESDIRKVAVNQPGVTTVVTENIGTVFGIFQSGNTLMFGAGSFDMGPLYSAPADGGRWSKFGAPEIRHLEVLGDTAYFSMSTETESGIYTSSPASPNSYSQIATGDITGEPIRNFFVTADFAYWFALKATNTARVYTKVSLAGGGQKQELGAAGSGILYAHNDAYVFYTDSTSTGVDNLMMMPLGGGTPTVLGTYESNEIRAAVADANNLYVAMGYMRTGGIVRFSLNP